jgi:Secretion system C-terminal sorting domain
MKQQFYAFFMLALLAHVTLHAQTLCGATQSTVTIKPNRIKANFSHGTLFSTLGNLGGLVPDIPQEDAVSTIFSVGLNIGGFDPTGNLLLASRTYHPFSGPTSYFAGPYVFDATVGVFVPSECIFWDRHFVVIGDDIQQFIIDLPNLTISQAIAEYPAIMGWPGKGNPHFSAVYSFTLPNGTQGLAPFVDADNDGNYNPMTGDYPAVQLRDITPFIPSQMAWSVFNTSGGITPQNTPVMEIQETVWGFDCPNDSVLQNTVFTAQKIIHRGTDLLDSLAISYFIDFDLGCFADDNIGTLPGQNAVYAYNADAVDGTVGFNCQVPSFQNIVPPVQSAVWLNQSLDKVIYHNNDGLGNFPPATLTPTTAPEIIGMMNGYWRDNTLLTEGGNGYGGTTPADYAFPDLPSDPNGWSECTANQPFGDRRLYATHQVGQFSPGAIIEMNLAWITTFNPSLPCGLGNTSAHISHIQNLYDEEFEGLCSPSSSTNSLTTLHNLNVSPNPAATSVTVEYPESRPRLITLVASDGRIVRRISEPAAEQTLLSVADLASGIYAIQILTDQGVAVRSLVVAR